jgi:hypothetical protein
MPEYIDSAEYFNLDTQAKILLFLIPRRDQYVVSNSGSISTHGPTVMGINLHGNIFDTVPITVTNKMTAGGATGAVVGGVAASNIGVWAGIVIGIVGLVLNYYFKSRADKRAEIAQTAWLAKLAASQEAKAPKEENE